MQRSSCNEGQKDALLQGPLPSAGVVGTSPLTTHTPSLVKTWCRGATQRGGGQVWGVLGGGGQDGVMPTIPLPMPTIPLSAAQKERRKEKRRRRNTRMQRSEGSQRRQGEETEREGEGEKHENADKKEDKQVVVVVMVEVQSDKQGVARMGLDCALRSTLFRCPSIILCEQQQGTVTSPDAEMEVGPTQKVEVAAVAAVEAQAAAKRMNKARWRSSRAHCVPAVH